MVFLKFLINHSSAWIPILIPLSFFIYIIITISFFGIVREEDEGIGAHLFQIWLLLEPFLVGFFAFKWFKREQKNALTVILLQIIAAFSLIATVFLLKL